MQEMYISISNHQAAREEKVFMKQHQLYLIVYNMLEHMPSRSDSGRTVMGVLYRLHMTRRRLEIKCNNCNVTII